MQKAQENDDQLKASVDKMTTMIHNEIEKLKKSETTLSSDMSKLKQGETTWSSDLST